MSYNPKGWRDYRNYPPAIPIENGGLEVVHGEPPQSPSNGIQLAEVTHIYVKASDATVADTTETTIKGTATFDTLSEHTASTGETLIKYDGIYLLNSNILMRSNVSPWSGTERLDLAWYVKPDGGAYVRRGLIISYPNSAVTFGTAQSTITLQLTTGDTVKCIVDQRSGGNSDIFGDHTWVTIDRLR